ncbi:MAG: I78 family peptidase inhibitor [Croceibacterium sp.]
MQSGHTAVCNPDGGMRFVGQMANVELGQRLMWATGARQLRWAPPGAALTMDLRPDRVTVTYDDHYQITRVSCG